MVKKEKSVIINRPIEDVFAYVSNLQNQPAWQSGLFEVRQINQGALGVGSQYAMVRKSLWLKFESNVEFVEYVPNRKFVLKSLSGSVPYEDTYLFEPVAGGTRLTNVIEMQPSGWMGLMEAMISGNVEREMASSFGHLKDLLDHPVPMTM